MILVPDQHASLCLGEKGIAVAAAGRPGGWVYKDHVFYLATNKHLKYETQGEVVSLA